MKATQARHWVTMATCYCSTQMKWGVFGLDATFFTIRSIVQLLAPAALKVENSAVPATKTLISSKSAFNSPTHWRVTVEWHQHMRRPAVLTSRSWVRMNKAYR